VPSPQVLDGLGGQMHVLWESDQEQPDSRALILDQRDGGQRRGDHRRRVLLVLDPRCLEERADSGPDAISEIAVRCGPLGGWQNPVSIGIENHGVGVGASGANPDHKPGTEGFGRREGCAVEWHGGGEKTKVARANGRVLSFEAALLCGLPCPNEELTRPAMHFIFRG
jgi:hypothetical protein